MTEDVFFYRRGESNGWASNFWRAVILLDGRDWSTNEHYFQAHKQLDSGYQEFIRLLPDPYRARTEGRAVVLRLDWEQVKEEVMLTALRAKFTQHLDLRKLLAATKDAKLHEDSPTDSYWGYANGAGKDRLGILLMQVRGELC